jgi:3-oxoacyl-[acyl-carrier protein] reductase
MSDDVPRVLSLEGRVAVVTGAGRGIGEATARLFARAGASVALLDRDGAGVTRTAEAIGVEGGEALPFTNDITDSYAVERTLDRVLEEWRHLDVLVNNAGALTEAALEDLTDDDLEASLEVNLKGTVVCTRAAIPHMLARGSGRILSAASMSTRLGAVGLTAYAASKAAVVGVTRTWARELGPRGITANAVAPGLIDSETIRIVPPEELEATVRRLPARRLGTPEEVAAVYLFLASDLASFINGAVVEVDGGLRLY